MEFGAGAGYRHRVRLSVRGRAASPKVGIFQEGSHQLVDIPRCAVHHPLINEVVARLKQAIKLTHTPPYADAPHAGLLRAVQVVVERSSETAQVVVVTNSERPEPAEPLLQALAELLGSKLHSLWWNGNPERTNRILGPHFVRRSGEDAVVDQMGGARVYFPPDAFGQANPELASQIVTRIHDWVSPGAKVVELYAGVGAIGLGLAARGFDVLFNELGEGSLRGLERGLRELGLDPAACVVPGPAEAAVGRAAGADVVIVDPPRKGLGPEVVAGLVAARPERLIYLSCGLDSFERDVPELERAFRLERIVAYGLFPFTEHVETLALFRAAP